MKDEGRKRIILASQSKARSQLLKQIGLSFISAHAHIREGRSLCGKPPESLVLANALLKAEEVARRYASGIVIAADTIVVVKGKVIGKPRTIKEAVKTLRLLSSTPQWVYTGIVVKDIENQNVLRDYEKTKVYMRPLDDEAIRRYFKKVSPLDKAGSFDIQGSGAVFVRRIEGCFYTVVGLPLAKLALMLKRVGVDIMKDEG